MVGRNLDTLNLDTVELVCMSVAAAELRVRLAALERIKLRASAVVEDHRSRHAAGGSAELQARLAALERVGERAQAVRAFGAACGGGPSSPPPAPAPAPTPAARGQDERLGSAAKKLVHEQVADLLEEDETNLPFLLRLLHGDSILRRCFRRVAAVRVAVRDISHLNDLHLIIDLNGFTFRHRRPVDIQLEGDAFASVFPGV